MIHDINRYTDTKGIIGTIIFNAKFINFLFFRIRRNITILIEHVALIVNAANLISSTIRRYGNTNGTGKL